MNEINNLINENEFLKKQLEELTNLYELSQTSLEQKSSKVTTLTTSLIVTQNEYNKKETTKSEGTEKVLLEV